MRPFADRLLQPPHPAAVLGEHAVGLEDVAVLARAGLRAARQQVVDGEAEARDRRVEACELVLDVLGDELR